MQNPENYFGYFGILTRAEAVVIVFYLIFGFMGYWKYGDEAMGSVLNNLPSDEMCVQCFSPFYNQANRYDNQVLSCLSAVCRNVSLSCFRLEYF